MVFRSFLCWTVPAPPAHLSPGASLGAFPSGSAGPAVLGPHEVQARSLGQRKIPWRRACLPLHCSDLEILWTEKLAGVQPTRRQSAQPSRRTPHSPLDAQGPCASPESTSPGALGSQRPIYLNPSAASQLHHLPPPASPTREEQRLNPTNPGISLLPEGFQDAGVSGAGRPWEIS